MMLAGGGASRPPLTAGALQSMSAEWVAGSQRLAGELTSLGQAAHAAGFFYRHTDETIIPMSPP